MGNAQARNLDSSKESYETRRIIKGKRYHVQYEEVEIDATINEVWEEISGNFAKGGDIAKSINSSYGLSGDVTEGLGAERYLNIDFQGKTIEAKERIIDFKECQNHKEFTYYVYESKGSPLQVDTYFTWSTWVGDDGKTYLGTYSIFRAKLPILTGLVGKIIAKSGSLRNGILTYKHYLETGEKKVDEGRLNKLYPKP